MQRSAPRPPCLIKNYSTVSIFVRKRCPYLARAYSIDNVCTCRSVDCNKKMILRVHVLHSTCTVHVQCVYTLLKSKKKKFAALSELLRVSGQSEARKSRLSELLRIAVGAFAAFTRAKRAPRLNLTGCDVRIAPRDLPGDLSTTSSREPRRPKGADAAQARCYGQTNLLDEL